MNTIKNLIIGGVVFFILAVMSLFSVAHAQMTNLPIASREVMKVYAFENVRYISASSHSDQYGGSSFNYWQEYNPAGEADPAEMVSILEGLDFWVETSNPRESDCYARATFHDMNGEQLFDSGYSFMLEFRDGKWRMPDLNLIMKLDQHAMIYIPDAQMMEILLRDETGRVVDRRYISGEDGFIYYPLDCTAKDAALLNLHGEVMVTYWNGNKIWTQTFDLNGNLTEKVRATSSVKSGIKNVLFFKDSDVVVNLKYDYYLNGAISPLVVLTVTENRWFNISGVMTKNNDSMSGIVSEIKGFSIHKAGTGWYYNQLEGQPFPLQVGVYYLTLDWLNGYGLTEGIEYYGPGDYGVGGGGGGNSIEATPVAISPELVPVVSDR